MGIDQIEVDVTRVFNGSQNCRLCYFVKNNTACILGIQTKNFSQVPGYGFSLAVLIGCQPHGL
ncbi:hypothetical protein RFZ44_21335, partial [Acinetobacter sp. 163]|nr:hypothetical protein [Acinetobacter sp. 163]